MVCRTRATCFSWSIRSPTATRSATGPSARRDTRQQQQHNNTLPHSDTMPTPHVSHIPYNNITTRQRHTAPRRPLSLHSGSARSWSLTCSNARGGSLPTTQTSTDTVRHSSPLDPPLRPPPRPPMPTRCPRVTQATGAPRTAAAASPLRAARRRPRRQSGCPTRSCMSSLTRARQPCRDHARDRAEIASGCPTRSCMSSLTRARQPCRDDA